MTACATQGRSSAGPNGEMSNWFAGQALARLSGELQRHPRYANQSFLVSVESSDALASSLAAAVRAELQNVSSVRLLEAPMTMTGEPLSVDSLDCQPLRQADYRVGVSVAGRNEGETQVLLRVHEDRAQSADLLRLIWQGPLSRDEARLLAVGQAEIGNGSAAAPYFAGDVEPIASRLTRELICFLRPNIVTRMTLHLTSDKSIDGRFIDILRATQYQLSRFSELTVVTDTSAADMILQLKTMPLSGERYQLWLHGEPAENRRLHKISVVTHITAEGLPKQGLAQRESRAPRPAVSPKAQRPTGIPGDYLRVQLLDAVQESAGRNRVALHVLLQLENSGDWPIEYSFSLSGGYYEHCLARDELFRHDALGNLKGTIEPGQRETKRLVIKGVYHKPFSVYGVSKCAGFRDLDAFRRFSDSGAAVTDYLRWAT